MKPFILISFFSLTIISIAHYILHPFPNTNKNKIISITDTNVGFLLSKGTKVFILFTKYNNKNEIYFMSKYEESAIESKNEKTFFAHIDLNLASSLLKNKFNIYQYPTIKLFIHGKEIEEYTAWDEKGSLTSWIEKGVNPIASHPTSVSDITNLIKHNYFVSVYFGRNEKDITAYENVSVEMDNQFGFSICSNTNMLSHYNIDHGNIIIFKDYGKSRNVFQSIVTEESISKFIRSNQPPITIGFNSHLAQNVFHHHHPALFIYRKRGVQPDTIYTELLGQILNNFLIEKLQFAIVDIDEIVNSKFSSYFKIKEKRFPCVCIYDTRNHETKIYKLSLDKTISAANIFNFISQWLSNELKPELKTEEIPETQNEIVRKIVGKNYKNEVIENNKDVLVRIYAPWGGHCKALAPVYKELARKLKYNKDIVIVEMDGTENEVEGIEISGFPTILFYPGNKKDEAPLRYLGERTVEDFIDFIKEHGVSKVLIENNEL